MRLNKHNKRIKKKENEYDIYINRSMEDTLLTSMGILNHVKNHQIYFKHRKTLITQLLDRYVTRHK